MESLWAILDDVAARLNREAAVLPGIADRLRLVREAVPSGRLCLTTSFGIEDQLLTAAAEELGEAIEVVTLDTLRLFPETLATWRATEAHTGRPIRALVPEPTALAALIARDGVDGFYDSVAKRHACCGVRKVEPLARALDGASTWITGLRGEQSAERASVAFAAVDRDRNLLKINPLHDWSREAVLAALGARDVPVSALEARGYRSVGCEPCTRAVRPHEPERAGRWWWEQQSARECGLHVVSRPSEPAPA